MQKKWPALLPTTSQHRLGRKPDAQGAGLPTCHKSELEGSPEFLRKDVELRVARGEKCLAVHNRQRLVAELVVVALHEKLPIWGNLVGKSGDRVPPGRGVGRR